MAKKSKKIEHKKHKIIFPDKIIKYLEDSGIPHEVLTHRTVYTAMDAAATMKKKLNEIAKSLLVKADKDYYLIILPADHNLDFKKLASVLSKLQQKKYAIVKIPGETIMHELLKLKDQTVSAFGQLHKLPVVVDKNLTKVKKAVFGSGTYNHSIQMAVKDFIKMEKALVGSFSVKKKIKVQKLVKSARGGSAKGGKAKKVAKSARGGKGKITKGKKGPKKGRKG
jgi:prolyl-tRNA editing enzyme YbaK/EbsC (Cys-tRNA(Pro) deacylase)